MKNHFVILTAVDSSSVTSLLLDTIGKYLHYLHYLHFSRNERHFLTLLVEIFHGSGGNISTAQNSITVECKIPSVDTVGFYRVRTNPLPDWRRTVK